MDYSNLIGIPYSQCDCFNLAKRFYKQVMGLELKHYYEETPTDRSIMRDLIYTNEKDFHKVKSPEFGDLILIKMYGIESHVGVFLGNGIFLHTTRPTGSCIDRIGKWNNMIVGYYSVVKR